jgi:hypothetical protein
MMMTWRWTARSPLREGSRTLAVRAVGGCEEDDRCEARRVSILRNQFVSKAMCGSLPVTCRGKPSQTQVRNKRTYQFELGPVLAQPALEPLVLVLTWTRRRCPRQPDMGRVSGRTAAVRGAAVPGAAGTTAADTSAPVCRTVGCGIGTRSPSSCAAGPWVLAPIVHDDNDDKKSGSLLAEFKQRMRLAALQRS